MILCWEMLMACQRYTHLRRRAPGLPLLPAVRRLPAAAVAM
jgi:hypothetical protein